MLKVKLCDFERAIFGNGVSELTWKDFVEKHLYYHLSFKELLRKNVISNALLLRIKNSCARSLKLDFGGTVYIHLPFKEFLKKWVFENKFGESRKFGNFVSIFPYLYYEVVKFVVSKAYSSPSYLWISLGLLILNIIILLKRRDVKSLFTWFIIGNWKGREFLLSLTFKGFCFKNFLWKIDKKVVPEKLCFEYFFLKILKEHFLFGVLSVFKTSCS